VNGPSKRALNVSAWIFVVIAGVAASRFSVELNDPDKLRITERRKNAAALQAHFATEQMATFASHHGRSPNAKHHRALL